MAYIGRDVDKISNVEVLDNITFDGSSSYTLQKNSVNFTPSSANTLLVSIDGVVQAGNFTVSSSTIDFGTAVSASSTCDFILHYGTGLITTPADGTVTTAKIADSAITSAKLASGAVPNQSAFKNIIINGDMSIAQRGTSESGITSYGYYTVDRFQVAPNTMGTWTMSQDSDVPSGQGFAKSLKINCTTADASPSAGDNLTISSNFEGQMLQYLKKGTASAESLTLSFWVKTNKTGTYVAELYDNDNTRTINKSFTVSSADTWEKKTITYDGDTTGAFGNDNGNSLGVNFWLGAGSNFTSGTLQTSWGSRVQANRAVGINNLADSTSNYINITGVQLEAGTTASDFEFLPHDVNLQRCLRYLPSIKVTTYSFGGHVIDSDSARKTFDLKVPARTAPTGISYDGTIKFANAGGTGQGTGISFYTATTDQLSIISAGTSSGNFSQGDSTSLNTDSNLTRTILCTGSEL